MLLANLLHLGPLLLICLLQGGVDGGTLFFVFLKQDVYSQGAYQGRCRYATKHSEIVKLQLIQTEEADEDIMEEQACLVNWHDFDLIVVLDAVVDIHQGETGSPRQ